MKNDTQRWLSFAQSNLGAAHCVFKNGFFNPCLQDIQQAVEKALKALLIETSSEIRKTHSVHELYDVLKNQGCSITLTDEECSFLDSIYLPSKYPLGGVLPDGEPDAAMCAFGLSIADRVFSDITRLLEKTSHTPLQ